MEQIPCLTFLTLLHCWVELFPIKLSWFLLHEISTDYTHLQIGLELIYLNLPALIADKEQQQNNKTH